MSYVKTTMGGGVGFCKKNFNFCKFAIFLQILKVEHKSFPMMYHLSYLTSNMEFRGWDQIDILVFSRDRVKIIFMKGYHVGKYKTVKYNRHLDLIN